MLTGGAEKWRTLQAAPALGRGAGFKPIGENQGEVKTNTQKVEVWAQDIQGIVYYIDKANNVYQAEDIVGNKTNPKIIAKYLKVGETYSIPEFNI